MHTILRGAFTCRRLATPVIPGIALPYPGAPRARGPRPCLRRPPCPSPALPVGRSDLADELTSHLGRPRLRPAKCRDQPAVTPHHATRRSRPVAKEPETAAEPGTASSAFRPPLPRRSFGRNLRTSPWVEPSPADQGQLGAGISVLKYSHAQLSRRRNVASRNRHHPHRAHLRARRHYPQ